MSASDSGWTGTPSVIMLGAASGLSPFGVTILAPLLAAMAERFAADFGRAQFLISAYLVGLALAQPVNGFLCDRFGRRPVMLTGFALFVAASTAAVFISALDQLIALRFLQAVGVSVGTVASRAVIRDTRNPRDAVEAMSWIAAAMGLAPILAPALGGWLGALGGYEALFAISALLGAMILCWAFVALPETLDRSQARPGWGQWMGNYRMLLNSGSFVGYSLVFGLVQGGFFSFLAVGAAVFEHAFALHESAFGLIWGLSSSAYVAGAIAGGRFFARVGPERTVSLAVLLLLVGGWSMPFAILAFGVTLAGLMLPLVVLMITSGVIVPGVLAGAVNSHPAIAGTSSGLSSAIGMTSGGLFSVAAGYIYETDFLPVAMLVALSATLTGVGWWLVRRYGLPITGPSAPRNGPETGVGFS